MLEIAVINDDHEKLREIKKIYRLLGPDKELLGPRPFFDKSEFRQIYRDRNRNVGFIEGKLIVNETAIYLNFGFSHHKYITQQNVETLLNTTFDLPKRTKECFVSTHLRDELKRSFLPNLGYHMIVSRQILLKYKLPTDGVHISYMKKL